MPFLRERSGRWSPVKIVAFILVCLPAVWLAWQAATATLGPRPWNEAIHQAGAWAVRLLLISLAITPARRIFSAPKLILARRTIGVAVFAYAVLHLTLYVFDQKLDLAKVASEIASRVYLTIGFVTLIGLMALAITSTDKMVQRLGGPRWQALHRLVYPLAMLAILHFLMQTKLDVSESIMMAGFLAWLLLYRVEVRFTSEPGPVRLVALAIVAAGLTALGEAAWYGFTTGADALLVLAANIDPVNLDPTIGLRPAGWVFLAGLGVAGAAAVWRLIPRRRPGAGGRPRPARARPMAIPVAGGGTR